MSKFPHLIIALEEAANQLDSIGDIKHANAIDHALKLITASAMKCPQCGFAGDEKSFADPGKTVTCPKCNAKVPTGSFCDRCGEKLSPSSEAPKEMGGPKAKPGYSARVEWDHVQQLTVPDDKGPFIIYEEGGQYKAKPAELQLSQGEVFVFYISALFKYVGQGSPHGGTMRVVKPAVMKAEDPDRKWFRLVEEGEIDIR